MTCSCSGAMAWSGDFQGVVMGAAVQVRCGGTALFVAKAGKRKNRVAVRIERPAVRAGG